jgi:hypothetical protein
MIRFPAALMIRNQRLGVQVAGRGLRQVHWKFKLPPRQDHRASDPGSRLITEQLEGPSGAEFEEHVSSWNFDFDQVRWYKWRTPSLWRVIRVNAAAGLGYRGQAQ